MDVYVGQDDRILRRLQVALDLDFNQVAGNAGGEPGRAKVDFSFELSDVNKPQNIVAPKKVAAGAPGSEAAGFSSAVLGVGVLAIDPPPGLAAARQAGFRIGDVTSPAPITNNPRKVAAAVRNHQRVVILFQNPRGLDDQATAEAVARPARPDQGQGLHRRHPQRGPLRADRAGRGREPGTVDRDHRPARQGTAHRGLHRLARPRSGSRRRPMSERQPGPAALRAVPDRGAEEAAEAEACNGLTPPQRRGGSRYITDVIAEMGFASERAREGGGGGGQGSMAGRPSSCWSRPARSPGTSSRARSRSASASSTWTCRCSRPTWRRST